MLSVLFIKMGLGLFGVALGTAFPGLAIYYFWIPNVTCRLIGEKKCVYWTRQIRTTIIAVAATLLPGLLVACFAVPQYTRLAFLAVVCFVLYSAAVCALGLTSAERSLAKAFLRNMFRAKTE